MFGGYRSYHVVVVVVSSDKGAYFWLTTTAEYYYRLHDIMRKPHCTPPLIRISVVTVIGRGDSHVTRVFWFFKIKAQIFEGLD